MDTEAVVVQGHHPLSYMSTAQVHPATLVHTSPHVEDLESDDREPKMFEVKQNHFHMERLEE